MPRLGGAKTQTDTIANAIHMAISEINGRVGQATISYLDLDDASTAMKVRASGADLVYFGGSAENKAGKLWQDLRATLDSSVKLMGPDGLYGPAFLAGGASAAEGTFVTFGSVPPRNLTGSGAAWYTSYRERFGEPYAFTAYGYEVARVALEAIRSAGRKDRDAIRKAILATRDYDGVLGRWSFTDTGDTTLTAMSGRRVKDGAFDDANAVILRAPAD
jgi:branched-chain amino acid transport system substrate-binding protein